MSKVTANWTYSAKQNLTNEQSNRRAWVGQAAACYALHCTDIETRQMWVTLTQEQQNTANLIADKVIEEWEVNNGYKNIFEQISLFGSSGTYFVGI